MEMVNKHTGHKATENNSMLNINTPQRDRHSTSEITFPHEMHVSVIVVCDVFLPVCLRVVCDVVHTGEFDAKDMNLIIQRIMSVFKYGFPSSTGFGLGFVYGMRDNDEPHGQNSKARGGSSE